MTSYLGNKLKAKRQKYLRRKVKTNTKLKAHSDEVRVIVNRSNKYIQAQAIGVDGKVVAMISDKQAQGATKTENAKNAGIKLAALLKKAKVEKVVFDRNGFLYHGRVKAMAEGIREGWISL